MAKVAFLWHMHQPCYRDALTGEVALPWVRLHACQSYLDMASVLAEFGEVKCNFNFSPSLIMQLKEYVEHGFDGDIFYELSMRDVADLSEDDALFILRHFFSVHWETEILPHHGYRRLLERRGTKDDPDSLAQSLKQFSKQDWFDLQVWFNLAWFGFTARKLYPELEELRRKGRDFTHEDKEIVFKCQMEIVKRIIPLYSELWDRGQIEITTSPFYHPILPLVINTDIARRATPDIQLPVRFSAPSDAMAQLKNAKRYMAETFGKEPSGLWPSEGAVCPELVPILTQTGFRYFATDQNILYLTSGRRQDDMIYRSYLVDIDGHECTAFFRDRNLSDAIGFSYSKNPPELAARDFMARLEQAASKAAGIEEPIVVVALDGENPWEYYPDQGEGFLTRIYAQLAGSDRFETVRLGDYLEHHPPTERLTSLHSGSWIESSFRIWIGHPEENKAWDLLNSTRSFVQGWIERNRPDAALFEAIMDQIYRAEGSDWFWWFGEDFTTIQDGIFDQLFRKHLENAYRLCGEEVPEILNEPIKAKPTLLVLPPVAFITPVIDGKVTDYYEWEPAGQCHSFQTRGSMHISHSLLKSMYFGFDLQNFYLRLDPSDELLDSPDTFRFKIDFPEPVAKDIVFRLPARGKFTAEVISARADERKKVAELEECAFEKIIEMKIPFDVLGAKVGDEVKFVVRIFRGEIEEDRHPKSGLISFTVPDENFENLMWSV